METVNKGLVEYKGNAYKWIGLFQDEIGQVIILRKFSGKRQYIVIREEELLIKNEENGTTE